MATAFPSTEVDYLAFNEKKAPFSDVHVRQAISDAIDRNALVNAVLFGNGKPANSLLMPGLPYYDGTGGESYDLAAAKKALAAVVGAARVHHDPADRVRQRQPVDGGSDRAVRAEAPGHHGEHPAA